MIKNVARFALVAFLASQVSGTTWSDDSKWEVGRSDILLTVHIGNAYGTVLGTMTKASEGGAKLDKQTCETAIAVINARVWKPLMKLEKRNKDLHQAIDEARYSLELQTAKSIEALGVECNLQRAHPLEFDNESDRP